MTRAVLVTGVSRDPAAPVARTLAAVGDRARVAVDLTGRATQQPLSALPVRRPSVTG